MAHMIANSDRQDALVALAEIEIRAYSLRKYLARQPAENGEVGVYVEQIQDDLAFIANQGILAMEALKLDPA